jgi:hypothetical protein
MMINILIWLHVEDLLDIFVNVQLDFFKSTTTHVQLDFFSFISSGGTHQL